MRVSGESNPDLPIQSPAPYPCATAAALKRTNVTLWTYFLICMDMSTFDSIHSWVTFVNFTINYIFSGGTIIITTRFKYLHTVDAYRDKLEPYMKDLELRGMWRQEERRVFSKYYMEDQGIVWRYTVLWRTHNHSFCFLFKLYSMIVILTSQLSMHMIFMIYVGSKMNNLPILGYRVWLHKLWYYSLLN